jgi:hypothetical protein
MFELLSRANPFYPDYPREKLLLVFASSQPLAAVS